MGDQLNKHDDLYARDHLLHRHILYLDEDSFPWILNHIDCFNRQARLNESIKTVHFYRYSGDCQDNEVWDKLGQAIGNLQALEKLYIRTNYDENGDLSTSAWEILACILRHVRQKIDVDITDIDDWDAEQSRYLAQAIHGHPTITSFEVGDEYFPYEFLDSVYSALATLPALESIRLCGCNELITPEDESALGHPESLTELLRVSTLRSVCFREFAFTPALCQATANALMEGTAITELEFIMCSFSAEGSAVMMASGLSRNTSVSHIKVVSSRDQALFDVLATALPSNSTLRRLDLRWQGSAYNYNLSPVLLALGKNLGLKILYIDGFGSVDESLCTAMKDGLGMNTTLENLELNCVHVTDDNYDLWCRALSFLRTNKVLKSLVVDLVVAQSGAVAFRTDLAAVLEENVSLESLSVPSFYKFKAEEYVALITALQHNTTLKALILQHRRRILRLTDDEDKQMAVVLQKNYALVTLPDIDLENTAGDVGAILRLNKAGRRYLIEDGSSISKGVKVLSAVSNEINCVFLHLSENPRLCDRNAVETVSDITDNTQGSRGSTSPANRNGKRNREQDQALKEDK
jgi:hypothetical protein